MGKAAAIAQNTVREIVRDKVFYILVFFALSLIALSKALGWISMQQDVKVIQDIALAAINLFVLLITIFLGTNLVYKEVEKRTIYSVLSKDVGRWQFVLGKALGLWATAVLCVAGMSATAVLYLVLLGGTLEPAFFLALYGIVLELGLITSISLLFSSLTSPVLSAFITFAFYVAGHSVEVLRKFVDEALARGFDPVAEFVYYALPNLENSNFKMFVGSPDLPEAGHVLWATVYTAVYSAVLIGLTLVVYRRKSF
jgi:ABC-type transport system involved in multi-copper enzyme maturation permease subunit